MSVPRTILIIDDDPDALNFASTALADNGYQIRKAAAWPEALDGLHAGRPDLVLLDLHLPGISGDALLEFIQEEHKDVPVVVAASDIDGDAMEALGKLGARGFIRKPYETDDLLVVVEQVMLDRAGAPEPVRSESPASRPAASLPSGAAPVAPGAGVQALTRERSPAVQLPRERIRRFKKRRSSPFRTLVKYVLIGILFILIGLVFYAVQQSLSGGFLGFGVANEEVVE